MLSSSATTRSVLNQRETQKYCRQNAPLIQQLWITVAVDDHCKQHNQSDSHRHPIRNIEYNSDLNNDRTNEKCLTTSYISSNTVRKAYNTTTIKYMLKQTISRKTDVD